ncbi:MAG: GntR family transcriptional regulator [Candidatus Hydrogenedentes bacterium]|nr:GntR family transcriptional regulator [Candidatus Hydrogenedentota bacterium]
MLDSINIDSQVPVYEQIENQVIFAVAGSDLKSGDQLPSVRELSERLALNPNTIAKAYRDLEVMEIVYTRRGMGVYIAPGAESKCRAKTRKHLVGRIYEVVCEAKAAGMSDSEFKKLSSTAFSEQGTLYGPLPQNLEKESRAKK